jgi:hypothetical protein
MKKMLSLKNILIVSFVFLGISCQKLEFTQKFSSTYPISGDWTITVNDGTNLNGPYFMKIYNTSFGKDSVWIDDNKTYWQTKSRVKVNMTNLTFSGDATQNAYYNSQVTYKNGKVIGKDSIYFEVSFSDDSAPYANTYIYAGHRKLSYEEYNTH